VQTNALPLTRNFLILKTDIKLIIAKKASGLYVNPERLKTAIKENRKMKKLTGLFMLVIVALLTGCASYTIRDGKGAIISQGQATGFLRTITVTEKLDKNGVVIERKISTESTTKDVLMGLNEFIDTAADTCGKLKP